MNNRKISMRTAAILLVAMMVITMTVTALVLYTLMKDATWTITKDYGLQVYTDAGCTTIKPSFNFGSFSRNYNSGWDLGYLKNEGNDAQPIFWNASNVEAGFTIEAEADTGSGYVAWDQNTNLFSLSKDESIAIRLRVISGDVEAGSYGASIGFYVGA